MIGIALEGRREESRQLSARGRVVTIPMAYTCFGLGEEDQGFDSLEKAFEQGDPMATGLNHLFGLHRYRSRPRFQELIHRLNLPE